MFFGDTAQLNVKPSSKKSIGMKHYPVKESKLCGLHITATSELQKFTLLDMKYNLKKTYSDFPVSEHIRLWWAVFYLATSKNKS